MDEALQIGGLFHLSISTWKFFVVIKNIFIMTNLTDFRRTVLKSLVFLSQGYSATVPFHT